MNHGIAGAGVTTVATHKHIFGLDLIRFAASLLVCVFHLGFVTWTRDADQVVAQATNAQFAMPSMIWTQHGWIGVEVFFVISGLVISFSAENAVPYRFAVSRAARLLPALWLCSTLALLFSVAADIAPLDRLFVRYGKSMTLFPWGKWIDSSHWTLPVEVAFYSLVLLCIVSGRRWALTALCYCLGSISLAYWLLLDSGFELLRGRDAQLLLLTHGVFFAIGMLLRAVSQHGWSPVRLAAFAAFAVGGVYEIADHHFAKSVLAPELSQGVVAPIAIWAASVGAILLSMRFNDRVGGSPRTRSFLRQLGLMTYPLYLLNLIVGSIVMGWLIRFGIHPLVAFATSLSGCITASWVISNWIEPHLQHGLKALLYAPFLLRLTNMVRTRQ